MFSLWSVPACYKQDSCSNELIVGQSPADKNVRTETEDRWRSVIRQRLVKTQQIDKTSYVLESTVECVS